MMQFCMKAPYWIYVTNSHLGLVFSPDYKYLCNTA